VKLGPNETPNIKELQGKRKLVVEDQPSVSENELVVNRVSRVGDVQRSHAECGLSKNGNTILLTRTRFPSNSHAAQATSNRF
jgi:hypothetical protein